VLVNGSSYHPAYYPDVAALLGIAYSTTSIYLYLPRDRDVLGGAGARAFVSSHAALHSFFPLPVPPVLP